MMRSRANFQDPWRALLAALVVATFMWSPTIASADSTGEQSPGATAGTYTNGANALACDGSVADATNGNTQTFSTYGLSIPGNAIITGIQVRVRANDGPTKNNR